MYFYKGAFTAPFLFGKNGFDLRVQAFFPPENGFVSLKSSFWGYQFCSDFARDSGELVYPVVNSL